jgi:hypothetical protein
MLQLIQAVKKMGRGDIITMVLNAIISYDFLIL